RTSVRTRVSSERRTHSRGVSPAAGTGARLLNEDVCGDLAAEVLDDLLLRLASGSRFRLRRRDVPLTPLAVDTADHLTRRRVDHLEARGPADELRRLPEIERHEVDDTSDGDVGVGHLVAADRESLPREALHDRRPDTIGILAGHLERDAKVLHEELLQLLSNRPQPREQIRGES